MAMTLATLVSRLDATIDHDRKWAILIGFLRENSIDSVVSAAAVVNAIPSADQDDSETIWSDEGVLKVSSAP